MKKSSVLVLTDYGTPEKLLLKALENGHQVTVVETAVEAMKELEKRKIDLIISRVFLENDDMFSFLMQLRRNQRLSKIPFICFSALDTPMARQLNGTLSNASHQLGAMAYLILDEYYKGEKCDTEALRKAIEEVIPASKKRLMKKFAS